MKNFIEHRRCMQWNRSASRKLLTMSGLLREITERNKTYMAAFARGDAAGISELYTEDCKLMAPGQDMLNGRQGVVQVFFGAVKAGAQKLLLETDEVGPMEQPHTHERQTIAYERGRYTFFLEGDKVMDNGKYLMIWKRLGDGKWYLYTDIFNSNIK